MIYILFKNTLPDVTDDLKTRLTSGHNGTLTTVITTIVYVIVPLYGIRITTCLWFQSRKRETSGSVIHKSLSYKIYFCFLVYKKNITVNIHIVAI